MSQLSDVVFVRSKKDPSLTELHKLNILECVQSTTTVHSQQHQYITVFFFLIALQSGKLGSVILFLYLCYKPYAKSEPHEFTVINYAFKVQNMIWSIHPTK